MESTGAYSWTGLYVGVHAGGGWSKVSDTVVDPFPTSGNFPAGTALTPYTGNGFLGGVQGGYNWQIGSWVLGVEGDYSGTAINGSGTTRSLVSPLIFSTSNGFIDGIGLATGRLGYAMDNWLFYAKGGGAWVQDHSNTVTTSAAVPPPSITAMANAYTNRSGWIAGGGIEWAFSHYVSFKIEYDHIDLGTENVTVSGKSGVIAGVNSVVAATSTIDVVKGGVNVHFDWFR